jgi:hypothetical protein
MSISTLRTISYRSLNSEHQRQLCTHDGLHQLAAPGGNGGGILSQTFH